MASHNVRIVVVEDDATVRKEILDALAGAGYDSMVATTLEMARKSVESHCDLILLDLMLPDGAGIDLCRELRAAGRSVPIIMVSAFGDPEERVRGLDAGADDYVVKPFHTPELIARVKSLLRRTGKSDSGGTVRHLDLWIDTGRRVAGQGDLEIKLKPREFELFGFLIRHPGTAWTREALLDHVWDQDYAGDPRTVDLHIRRLRAKIRPPGQGHRYIETVWGKGYRMSESAPAAREGDEDPPQAASATSLP